MKVGPRYGWVIVAALSVLLGATHGLITSGMSVFDKSILVDLDINRGTLKFREFLQLVSGGLFSIVIGYVATRIGPRTIIYAGLALLTVVLALYSRVTDIGQIYALHVALAFCYASCHVVVVVLIITRWFAARRSIALGIILAGESLGGTLFPQLVVRLIDHFGWRGSMEILAVMPLFLALLMLLVLRKGPEAYGQPKLGQPAPRAAQPEAARPRQEELSFPAALLQRSTLLLLATAALIFYAGSTFITHAYLSFLDRQFDAHRAATALSLLFVAAFVGKFSSGFIAERFGLNRSWIGGQLVLLVGALLFTFGAGASLVAGTLLVGFGWGCSYTLTQSRVMEQFSGPWLARLSGIAVFMEGSFSGIGTWQAGLIYDRTGSYEIPFAIMCGAVVAAILAAAALTGAAVGRAAARAG